MSNPASLPAEVLDALSDGVYLVDQDRNVTSWNAAAEDISGYAPREMLGHWCGDGLLSHVDDDGRPMCGERCPLLQTLHDGRPRTAQVMLHHREGHLVPVEIRAVAVRDADGGIVGAVETFRDDTRRFDDPVPVRPAEPGALAVDSLTGLGNRASLEAVMVDRMSALAREGVPLGVLVCDIDGFTAVNERSGHDVGDRVLQVVAETLAHCLPGVGRAFRYGGDEFVGLVAYDDLARLAARLCTYVAQSRVVLEDEVVRVTVSAGATMAAPGEDYADVLRRATGLLAEARAAGGNRGVSDVPTGRA